MSHHAASQFQNRERRSFLLFLLCPVVLFLGAYVYPVLNTVQLSFYDWNGMSPDMTYVGLENYRMILSEPRVQHAFVNNLKWLVYYLVVPTSVGLGLALLLDSDLPGTYVFRTIFFIPFTITTVAVASVWRWIYEPNIGLLSEVLKAVGLGGLAHNWLGDPSTNTYAIMLASLWAWSGFTFLIYFAGLRNLPAELIEAAKLDGASAWTILLRIKLPLLIPSTIVVMGIAAIDSMRVFDIVWAMTEGGPYDSSSVLAVEMYSTSFARFQMGAGAAVAVLLFLVAAIVVMPYVFYMSGRMEDIRE
ncbi:sugar ABC transporter permease (plasmid) [Agrobacterium tumefaciens]|uniref:Sugar ABC transporter permease n=1 Tax=Agrobacterium tumefaciens TaxID=358 RepID=A0AAP9EAE6_AGRTU|nr:sugar ABC transporter permease [Agrobacterium tumefaciens]NSZ61175.1 sugar ABC transporter permease [Agrobacterium tumefaciens]QDY97587.1 sugar ABC transporter permease [Agrobacterium tumefaciens]UXS12714.1 sugar ABC transporter permease [Agrobacterium tumefaciens]UXS20076.1 sugar ABC transporter permease [Agrobacterium tumefaciens]UXS27724.1 sugar ABC transporter permease [Agrobacterium tumefaciens]